MGSSSEFALFEHVQLPIAILDSYAELPAHDELSTELGNSLITREPVGVVGAITPWNYLFYQLVFKVAPALLAGYTVAASPCDLPPLSATKFTELLDGIGLAADTFNLVHGTGSQVDEALTEHPEVDGVPFTGSTCAGRCVAQRKGNGRKRFVLELARRIRAEQFYLNGADFNMQARIGGAKQSGLAENWAPSNWMKSWRSRQSAVNRRPIRTFRRK